MNRETGDFGSDLAQLRAVYSAPKNTHGNYVFDMWGGQTLATVLANVGLTNNNALIINSHAKGIQTANGVRHAYYPHVDVSKSAATPYFSALDIASVIGSQNLARIHNIVLAGCNREGSFDAAELRKAFPWATNIVHMTAGEAGYQPMLLQVFVTESKNIRPLYQISRKTSAGQTQFDIVREPVPEATRLGTYVAELFEPGAKQPFRVQIAGRELLDPKSATSNNPLSTSVAQGPETITADDLIVPRIEQDDLDPGS